MEEEERRRRWRWWRWRWQRRRWRLAKTAVESGVGPTPVGGIAGSCWVLMTQITGIGESSTFVSAITWSNGLFFVSGWQEHFGGTKLLVPKMDRHACKQCIGETCLIDLVLRCLSNVISHSDRDVIYWRESGDQRDVEDIFWWLMSHRWLLSIGMMFVIR